MREESSIQVADAELQTSANKLAANFFEHQTLARFVPIGETFPAECNQAAAGVSPGELVESVHGMAYLAALATKPAAITPTISAPELIAYRDFDPPFGRLCHQVDEATGLASVMPRRLSVEQQGERDNS